MPQRFAPIIAEVTTLLSGALTAVIASAATLIPNAVVETESGPLPVVIMDNEKMRLVCIIGAVAGAVITTFLSCEKEQPGVRVLISRVFLSTLCGVIGTPGVFAWMHWMPNTDSLLEVSAGVAMVGVAILRTALPLWQKYGASKLSPPQQ